MFFGLLFCQNQHPASRAEKWINESSIYSAKYQTLIKQYTKNKYFSIYPKEETVL